MPQVFKTLIELLLGNSQQIQQAKQIFNEHPEYIDITDQHNNWLKNFITRYNHNISGDVFATKRENNLLFTLLFVHKLNTISLLNHYYNYTEAVNLLLNLNINIHHINIYELQVLNIVSHSLVDFKLTKYLLDNNADPNHQDNINSTALLYATEQNHIHIVKLLIHYKAEVNIPNHDKETCLTEAIKQNNIRMVATLLSHNADVNFLDKAQYSPLAIAIFLNSSPQIINSLIEANANIFIHVPQKKSLLNLAIENNNTNAINILMDYACQQKGSTPEFWQQNFLINHNIFINTTNRFTQVRSAGPKEIFITTLLVLLLNNVPITNKNKLWNHIMFPDLLDNIDNIYNRFEVLTPTCIRYTPALPQAQKKIYIGYWPTSHQSINIQDNPYITTKIKTIHNTLKNAFLECDKQRFDSYLVIHNLKASCRDWRTAILQKTRNKTTLDTSAAYIEKNDIKNKICSFLFEYPKPKWQGEIEMLSLILQQQLAHHKSFNFS